LGADHGGAPFVTSIDDLEDFAGLGAGKRGEPEVIETDLSKSLTVKLA
jgi:hypothetical protein